MKLIRLILPALALSLASSSLLLAQNGPPQDRPQEGYGQQHQDMDHGGWDAPPQEFRDMQRQGFRDGIQAARSDVESHRQPDAERTREFQRPPVPMPAQDEYRDGFRRGYSMAISHSHEGMGSGPMPMPMVQNGPPQDHPQGYGQQQPDQNRGGWDAPPQEFRDVQRQGFHDGIEAARSDFQSHRPLSAERRNEFRRPPVSRESRDEYREGFRRGYSSAFSHFREDHDHHGDEHDHN
jgi:Spy/CpxP family protein refolding chaperone